MARPAEILLVEDSPTDWRLTVEALKRGRWAKQPHVVRDGEEALSFLHHEGAYAHSPRPDLIILDLSLPKKDGWEVLEHVKTDSQLNKIPVVVLTGSNRQEDIDHSYALGADCFLTKPNDLDMYFSVVRGIERFLVSMKHLPRPEVHLDHEVSGPTPSADSGAKNPWLDYLWMVMVLFLLFVCGSLLI